jgi:hypothetical protein
MVDKFMNDPVKVLVKRDELTLEVIIRKYNDDMGEMFLTCGMSG